MKRRIALFMLTVLVAGSKLGPTTNGRRLTSRAATAALPPWRLRNQGRIPRDRCNRCAAGIAACRRFPTENAAVLRAIVRRSEVVGDISGSAVAGPDSNCSEAELRCPDRGDENLEAQSIVGITRGAQLPSVYAGASGADQRSPRQKNLPPKYETSSNSVSASLVWDLDFWGKYRRATEAARATCWLQKRLAGKS